MAETMIEAQLAGLKIYGIASKSKYAALAEYGAALIIVTRILSPSSASWSQTGWMQSLMARRRLFAARLCFAQAQRHWGGLCQSAQLFWHAASAGARHLAQPVAQWPARLFWTEPFLQDWAALFKLLKAGKIKPVIAARFPILEAAQANALLESGTVAGNVALLSPELLEAKH